MKKVLITLVSLLVLLVTLNNLHAQDKKEKHEVHVKVKKIVNGKETMVDSTFTIDGDADLDEIMKILGKDMGELHEHEDGDVDVKIKTRKRVERRVIKEGKDGEKEVEVHVEVEGDDDGNVFIFKPENGDEEKVMIRIEGDVDVEDENVFIMKSSDGKVIEMDGEDKDVIIIKDGKVIDMKDGDGEKKVIKIHVDTDGEEDGETMIWKSEDGKVIEIDGDDGEKKTIRINVNGKDGETMMWKSKDGKVMEIDGEDGEKKVIRINVDDKDGETMMWKSEDGKVIKIDGEDGEKQVIRIQMDKDGDKDGNKMIWKSEDGKVIEIDGDKVEKKEMVFIRKSGDGDGEMSDEEIKKLLKEKGIDWEEMKADGATIKKSSNINVSINPINDEDKNALKGMGLEEKDYDGGLEISEMMMNVESGGPVMMQVDTEESGHLTAVVRDTEGEVISKTVLKESSNAYKIYLNLDQSGTYYVTLSQAGKSLTQKLVIKKA